MVKRYPGGIITSNVSYSYQANLLRLEGGFLFDTILDSKYSIAYQTSLLKPLLTTIQYVLVAGVS